MPDAFIKWRSSSLEELDALTAYQVFQLRQTVFVLEQACLYPDIDELDKQAIHLLGTDAEQNLIAYLRILPPGSHYKEPAIGRVLVEQSNRGTGLGGLLIDEGVRVLRQHYGEVAVRISAQSYLLSLYKDAGFNVVGDEYLEDDIPHTEMLLSAP